MWRGGVGVRARVYMCVPARVCACLHVCVCGVAVPVNRPVEPAEAPHLNDGPLSLQKRNSVLFAISSSSNSVQTRPTIQSTSARASPNLPLLVTFTNEHDEYCNPGMFGLYKYAERVCV